MAASVFGDLVLPDVSYKLSDYYDDEKFNDFPKQLEVDGPAQSFAPMPSAGTRRVSDSEMGARIASHRKSLNRRATQIFLSEWRSHDPKHAFRNIVRAVVRANRWRINLEGEDTAETLTRALYGESTSDSINFNVHAFKMATTRNLGLSRRARFVLLKDPWERTKEEKEILFAVVNEMKCFSKYSPLVRRELSSVINFETFEDGRIIIQEGYCGISMYFIVSGSVTVQIKQTDLKTGQRKNYIIGEIAAGSSFGELALIQDCRRTATIVCKGTSQFLRVDKSDFHMVSRRSYEKEWQDRMRVVKSVPFFADWNEINLRHITLNCFVEEFKPDTIIMGNTDNTPQNIYFVLSGICRMVRKVSVLETIPCAGGTKMLSLPPSSVGMHKLTRSSMSKQEIKTRYLHIGTLRLGDYFGLGEDMTSYYILSKTRVECLLVPRHSIIALERVAAMTGDVLSVRFTLAGMLREAKSRLMNENKVFENWMTNLRWRNYKRKIVREVLSRKKESQNRPSKVFPLKDFHVHDQRQRPVIVSSQNQPIPPHKNMTYSKGGYLNTKYVTLPKVKKEKPTDSRRESQASTDSTTEKKLTAIEEKDGLSPLKSSEDSSQDVVGILMKRRSTLVDQFQKKKDERRGGSTVLRTRTLFNASFKRGHIHLEKITA